MLHKRRVIEILKVDSDIDFKEFYFYRFDKKKKAGLLIFMLWICIVHFIQLLIMI